MWPLCPYSDTSSKALDVDRQQHVSIEFGLALISRYAKVEASVYSSGGYDLVCTSGLHIKCNSCNLDLGKHGMA